MCSGDTFETYPTLLTHGGDRDGFDANSFVSGPGVDEFSEVVDAETHCVADANGFELAAHDL
jgi:hypothetical protein